MRAAIEGLLVETDVFVEYLTATGDSVLRRALKIVPCYTTVIHAAELFAGAETEEEVRLVRSALGGIRVLGLSARYAVAMGAAVRNARKRGMELSERDAIVVGAAIEARLPVLTADRASLFSGIDGMSVVTPDQLEKLVKQQEG